MRLALYQPDIPQNTGTMLRMAACLGVACDIVLPAGFDVSDRAFRRAGMDYLFHADVHRHESFEAFRAHRLADDRSRLILLSVHADDIHTRFAFRPDDVLMVGRESAGVPADVRSCADAIVKIPLREGLRSLNVAVAAAIVLGEALRQTDGFPRQA